MLAHFLFLAECLARIRCCGYDWNCNRLLVYIKHSGNHGKGILSAPIHCVSMLNSYRLLLHLTVKEKFRQ